MNNTQFRRLVLDAPGPASRKDADVPGTTARGGATPALGSRMRSSIPMTPRSVSGSSSNEFARQLAERNASLNPSITKKFRSTAAPKGTKLGSRYQDRTKLLTSDEEDDKARRVKALEEMVKLGQMEQSTFEALRDEIVGGEISNVHLVKGLDRKLLERVRRGEDVLSRGTEAAKGAAEELDPSQASLAPANVDVDEEFDQLERKEIQPIAKQEKAKHGEMLPPQIAGKKRTRDDILRELRASRLLATKSTKQAAPPTLGPKFTKLGQQKDISRIEKDERGREVLITVDENGKVKRKVKKATIRDEAPRNHGLLMPDKDAQPLGMEVALPRTVEEEVDGDIFDGVGADYDPLKGLEDDEDEFDDYKDTTPDAVSKPTLEAANMTSAILPSTDQANMPPPPLPNKTATNRKNYFEEAETKGNNDTEAANKLTDPTILAALKKAATINPLSSQSSMAESEEEVAKLARQKKMLEAHDRDAEDMDLGFGSSRFGDEEEAEGEKVKFSVWGQDGSQGDGRSEGKGARKRGPKKKTKKGDVNSAAEVVKVMERRKAEGK